MKLHRGRFVFDDKSRHEPIRVAPPTLGTGIKLFVLVGSSRGFPYDEFLENWKQAVLPPNVKVYYYFHIEGISDIEVHGDELHIPGVESPLQSHPKTISAYKWALENEEFDVLLRPGLSSAFHFPKLLEWLNAKPKANHAFGRKAFDSFLSGCGYALTRDVVERFVTYSPNRVVEDDLVLCDFLRGTDVGITEWTLDFERPVNADIYNDPNFHLRFKTTVVIGDRAPDVTNHRKTIEHWNTQICE